MKCYRLSTVRSIVNYVDNSRPVEKFGVAYYSWLEATVREHVFHALSPGFRTCIREKSGISDRIASQ
jgi:hypothetical protein